MGRSVTVDLPRPILGRGSGTSQAEASSSAKRTGGEGAAANRARELGVVGSITLTSTAWAQVADRCVGESLGAVSVKGKGVLELVRFERFAQH